MSSPITVSQSPLIVASYNENRALIRFQNTGNWEIALSKQIPGAPPNIPSENNYDVLLNKAGEESDAFETTSIAGWAGVVISPGQSDKTSEIAITETVYISSRRNVGGCGCG